MELPRKPSLFELLPVLEDFAAVTTELMVEPIRKGGESRSDAATDDSLGTVLGYVGWPVGEAWPWREPDAETMRVWQEWEPQPDDLEPVPQPFLPVLQLAREDAFRLRFPAGKDLLQVLWHRYEHEWEPKVIVKWRARRELDEGLAVPPKAELTSFQQGLAPTRQRLVTRQVWVLPDIRTTTREVMRAVAAIEREVDHRQSAYHEAKQAHEQAQLGHEWLAMAQAFFSSVSTSRENPAALVEKGKALVEAVETKRRGSLLPVFDAKEPPESYLELGLAKGIRLGLDGMCPQVLTEPLPPAGLRHLLTFGEEAWRGIEWVVPRGGGNIHVFLEADEETSRVYCDCWAGVVSSVEEYLDPYWGQRFAERGEKGGPGE
jgi:hypothetical protein